MIVEAGRSPIGKKKGQQTRRSTGSCAACGADTSWLRAPGESITYRSSNASWKRPLDKDFLSESNSTFTVGPSSTPLTGRASGKRHKRGTVFSFRLDQPATVKIAIQMKAPGRRLGRNCRADTRRLRRKPRCTRTITIATLTRSGHAGLNKVAFSGRVRSSALTPGRYQATFTAEDNAGASPPQTLSFTIVRR